VKDIAHPISTKKSSSKKAAVTIENNNNNNKNLGFEEKLQKIEENQHHFEQMQQEQMKLLHTLLEQQQQHHTALLSSPNPFTPSPTSSSSNSPNSVPCSPGLDVEEAFMHFVSAFSSLQPHERPAKVRRLYSRVPTEDFMPFTECIALFSNEIGMNGGYCIPEVENQQHFLLDNPLFCSEDQKTQELKLLDEFYTEFLASPDTQNSSPLDFSCINNL